MTHLPEVALAELGSRAQALTRHLDAFLAGGGDAAVHDLRVAARRLRAALTVFAPLLLLPDTVRRRPLRRLERRAGALRDLEVLGALLRRHGDAEADLAATLDAELAAEREPAARRARGQARKGRLRVLRQDLDCWLEAPAFTPTAGLSAAAVCPDLLLPVLSEVLLEPAWAIARWPAAGAPEAAPLHRLRRRIKRLRYAVECLHVVLEPAVAAWLEELHAIQDALGAWHDAGVLLARLERLAPPGPLHAAVSGEASAALAPWPAWRERYGGAEARTRLRALLAVPPDEAGARDGGG